MTKRKAEPPEEDVLDGVAASIAKALDAKFGPAVPSVTQEAADKIRQPAPDDKEDISVSQQGGPEE